MNYINFSKACKCFNFWIFFFQCWGRTQGLVHAKQALYHWPTPATSFFFSIEIHYSSVNNYSKQNQLYRVPIVHFLSGQNTKPWFKPQGDCRKPCLRSPAGSRFSARHCHHHFPVQRGTYPVLSIWDNQNNKALSGPTSGSCNTIAAWLVLEDISAPSPPPPRLSGSLSVGLKEGFHPGLL